MRVRVVPCFCMVAKMRIAKDFNEFSPAKYLAEQYDIQNAPEMRFILCFLHDTYRALGRNNLRILEIGGGAAIYQLISASRYSKTIIFTDFLEGNLQEVRQWVSGQKNLFDWQPYFRIVAEWEKGHNAKKLKQRLQSKMTKIFPLDILHEESPLKGKTFDVVSTHFCPESIQNKRSTFLKALRTITSYVKPRGTLVMSAVKNFTSYQVGKYYFPAYPIDEKTLRRALRALGFSSIEIQTIDVEVDGEQYANMCVRAVRDTHIGIQFKNCNICILVPSPKLL